MQQVAKLREEEASESSWFVLPEEGDEDVNWMNFTVEIEGPVRLRATRNSSSRRVRAEQTGTTVDDKLMQYFRTITVSAAMVCLLSAAGELHCEP